jgi:hypothetical protein
MSRPMPDTPTRRPRRQFTDEFKASVVRLVLDEGKTVGAAPFEPDGDLRRDARSRDSQRNTGRGVRGAG